MFARKKPVFVLTSVRPVKDHQLPVLHIYVYIECAEHDS